MKKTIIISTFALAACLVSCDMEKLPYTGIEETVAIESVQDCTNYRVSIYSGLKGLTTGNRLTIEDTRSDLFNSMADFGNFLGLYHAWIMQTTDADAEDIWYGNYSVIKNVNYAIDAFPKFLAKKDQLKLTEDEVNLINLYIAEAHMTRAIAYADLAQKYCVAYDPTTAETAYGLPLQKTYAPTSESAKYPARSSLKDTYAFILEDVAAAEAITTPGAQNSPYYTSDVVKAFKARIALYTRDYPTAAALANGLVSSPIYKLAKTQAEHDALWLNDTSAENIMLVTMTLQDRGNATGEYYIYDSATGDGSTPDPQYIPTKTLLDLYDSAKDIRYSTYFKTRNVTAEGFGTADLAIFFKFPGNPALYSGTKSNYCNMGKPFRIAEQYLIAAEAYANIGDAASVTLGNNILKALRESRITGYTHTTYSASELLTQVKIERAKELVGEGFRMVDLKRWGQDVVRGASQDDVMTKVGENYADLNKPITDSRAVWPIPKIEIDANPQIKPQQNAGY